MITLKRKDNWPKLMAQFIESRLDTPFAWGTNDCGTFAADLIEVLTGVDVSISIQRTYTDQAGAEAALLAAAGGGIVEFLNKVVTDYGMKEVHINFAQRGDLSLYQHPVLGPTIVIVGMDGLRVIGPGDKGLAHYKKSDCEKAWRVGA